MEEHDFKRRLRYRPANTSIKVTDRTNEGPLTKTAIAVGDMVKLKTGDRDLAVRIDKIDDEQEFIEGKVCGITETNERPPHPAEKTIYHDGTPNVGGWIDFSIDHVWEVSE